MLRLPAGRQAQSAANKVFSYFRVLASMACRLIEVFSGIAAGHSL